MTEKQKQIGFRGSEEYRHWVHGLAHARKMKVQEFLEKAVESFVTPAEGGELPDENKLHRTEIMPRGDILDETVPVDPITNPLELRCYHLLSAIFQGQNQQAIAAITSNLEAFATLTALTSSTKVRREQASAVVDAAAAAEEQIRSGRILDTTEEGRLEHAATGTSDSRGAAKKPAGRRGRPGNTGN